MSRELRLSVSADARGVLVYLTRGDINLKIKYLYG